MEISNLIPHIEALIFASDKPLTPIDITELINNAFGFMEDKVTLDHVEASIEGIVEKYNSEFYPFEVKQSGGGWQFLTKKDYHKTIAQLNGEKFLKRLSAAALETLAIIAYKQPITKGEIETIRGVSTDYTIQKLLEKELIVISGRNEQLPGHPLIYSTSKSFMDYFGVNSADDLPKIKEVLANQIMEGTVISHTQFEPASTLAVADNGELIEEGSTSEDVMLENKNTEASDIVSSDLEISEPAEENESSEEFSPEQSSQEEIESGSPDQNEGNQGDNSSGDESSDSGRSSSSEEEQ
jgi:segregation and condensation protein B